MSYRKEEIKAKIVTFSEYEQNKQLMESERIYISSSIAKYREIRNMISAIVREKAQTGKQIIILDNLNLYHDKLRSRLEGSGYRVYNIDPYDDYDNSDSINILPLLAEDPNVKHWSYTFIEDLIGRRDAPKAKLAYSYYTEVVEPEAAKQTVAGLFDTILRFNSLSEEDLTDMEKTPQTAKLYSEIFYGYVSEHGYVPAEAAEKASEIHKEIVGSVEMLLSRDAEVSPKYIKGVKEVYSGARRKVISLDSSESCKRAIFLNTPGLATDRVANLLFKVFVAAEPTSIIVLDGSLTYNKSAISLPSFCSHFITADTTFYSKADLIVIEDKDNRNAEEAFLYRTHSSTYTRILPAIKAVYNTVIRAMYIFAWFIALTGMHPQFLIGDNSAVTAIEFSKLLISMFGPMFKAGLVISAVVEISWCLADKLLELFEEFSEKVAKRGCTKK